MVSTGTDHESSPVSGMKISSVVPAEASGNRDHELTNIDLAVKLHYIKSVQFFDSEAAQGLTVPVLKNPMFHLLKLFYPASGRIRRIMSPSSFPEGSSRPFIKCNDGGVRVVEARCDDHTVDEWLAVDRDSRDDCLAYTHVLGPDLEFSPLVFVQFTWFKCGGMSLGLTWAHVLGDPLSATAFINMWGRILAGHVTPKSLRVPRLKNPKTQSPYPGERKLCPVKRVDPVGDIWQIPKNSNMKSHTFLFTAKNYSRDQMAAAKVSEFEVICATIWKLLSKVREDSGPGAVTICRYSDNEQHREGEMAANDMVLRTVEVDFSVAKCDVWELATLIADNSRRKNDDDDNPAAENLSESSDLIVYGANLTFVNMEEADVYGLELQEKKPVFVTHSIYGVGEEGVVLVLAGPEEESGRGRGRTVTVLLPENQIQKLRTELNQEGKQGSCLMLNCD